MLKKLSFILITLLFATIIYASEEVRNHQISNIPFSPNEIIEQVSHYPEKLGDKIVIKDRAYEAYFDKKGIIVKARRTKVKAQDLVIPINGKPEIKDGKVIYNTKEGIISFCGTKSGLRYENFTNGKRKRLKYSGNVASLKNGGFNRQQNGEIFETGEFLINTSIVYVPAQDDQNYPVVASDGRSIYLVVWQDWRNGSYPQLFGAHVHRLGMVYEHAGFLISPLNDEIEERWLSIAFGPDQYLIVWADRGTDDYNIYGVRIHSYGPVIDTMPIAISTAENDQYSVSATFDGVNYFVAWHDERNQDQSNIYGARVRTSGIVLDTAGIAISTRPEYQDFPAIASDGTNSLVVWESDLSEYDSDILGARVNQAGAVIDTEAIKISSEPAYQVYPVISFGDTNYLVVWEDWRSGSTAEIYGTRVNQNGNVLEPDGIAIAITSGYENYPAVAFDSTNYLVVWQHNYYGIYGTRVSSAGIVLDTAAIVISTGESFTEYPALAFNGTNFLVVWQEYWYRSGSGEDIYGARINQAGIVLDTAGIFISTGTNNQWSPAVAFDSTNYLVVWEDDRGKDIFGARVNQDGIIIDTDEIAISTAIGSQVSPVVAFDGINYFIFWQDYRNGDSSHIYGTRMDRNGLVLDPAGILISGLNYEQSSPAISFDGTNYLVVWGDQRNYSICGTRITRTGLILDPAGIFITTSLYNDEGASLSFDGTNYFVVWRDYRYGSNIYGARVNQNGIVLDPDGIAVTDTFVRDEPSVAFDGTNYLVVFAIEDYPPYHQNIVGVRVSQTGVVLDSICLSISADSNYKHSPAVAFDGVNYIILWQEQRGTSYDIYGAKVNPSGSVLDTFPITTQPGNQESPALARGIDNQVLIVYSGWTERAHGETFNSMRIWGKFYPFVGIEEESSIIGDKGITLEIYPNPAKSFLAIRFPLSADRQTLKIFDVSGKLVKLEEKVTSAQKHKQEMKISLKGISPGIYFLRLSKETKKFLVVR